MNQPTVRQQILAAMLVCGCFLVGGVFEGLVGDQGTQPLIAPVGSDLQAQTSPPGGTLPSGDRYQSVGISPTTATP